MKHLENSTDCAGICFASHHSNPIDMRKLCHAIYHLRILRYAAVTYDSGSHDALAATPYRDKNFTGSQRGPLRNNFSITSNAHTRLIATPPSNAQLVANIYPTLVPGHATVGLLGLPNTWAYIQVVDWFGHFFPGNTEKF